MTRVVHLHIGAPKTGTTYIQTRLGRNTKTLAEHGVHFPSISRFARPELSQFRAALDLTEQDWGGAPGHADGAWDALMRRTRRLDGNVIISHEILAPAQSKMIERAMRDLAGSEIHIVYSGRDLARSLSAAWQESVKQGRAWTFRKFLRRSRMGKPFMMQAFDIPDVLSSWGVAVPPERIHLVVVPSKANAASDDTLWTRMCRAFDIDPAWAPLDSDAANKSLGVAETQVLRQLNQALGRKVAREGDYDDLLRRMVADGSLFHHRSAPVTLRPDNYDWVEERTERSLEWIAASGIDVIGDLDELRPRRPDPAARWANPDRVKKQAITRAAVGALSSMTAEAARRPDPHGLAVRATREIKRRLEP
ncbi:hypothetical protein F0U44_06835 [Nocardioides humilatus]|uniref:Sulfotransferase family protein n=1 Tax=Nocardioides humilatus TaxID=2607660 RepID=A0A5B1LPK2_9ACTN|nr:hypothetical protein [Nocardioides humilatus]KAA1421968.1 hypothetical protein F0U44_06835 [Nocardioides humilatus]